MYCAPNQFRTDRNESTLAGYRQSGDYLRGKEDLELPGGYNAVVLRRTPAAQPVQRTSLEAFFSSREFLYHFVLGAGPPQRGTGRMEEDAGCACLCPWITADRKSGSGDYRTRIDAPSGLCGRFSRFFFRGLMGVAQASG